MGKVYCNPIAVAPEKLFCECAGDLEDSLALAIHGNAPLKPTAGLNGPLAIYG